MRLINFGHLRHLQITHSLCSIYITRLERCNEYRITNTCSLHIQNSECPNWNKKYIIHLHSMGSNRACLFFCLLAAAAMLLFTLYRELLFQIFVFYKNLYPNHISLHGPVVSGVNPHLASSFAHRVNITDCRKWKCINLGYTLVHTKFHPNLSTRSQIESCRQTNRQQTWLMVTL